MPGMSARSMIVASCFLLNSFIVSAQVSWTNVDSIYRPLPTSIHVFQSNDSLNGRPLNAYYISVEIADKNIAFNTDTGRTTLKGFYEKKRKPLVVVNGSFFNPNTFENLNVIISNSRMLSQNINSLKSLQSNFYYYPTRSAIGITKKRKADVAWLFTDMARRWPYGFQKNPIVARGKQANPILADLNTLDNWKPWRMRTAIGGGPVLIQNGQIRITNQEEQMFLGDNLELTARTAMGYTKANRLIVLVIEGGHTNLKGGATLSETAEILKALGCIEALNLNGGEYSSMLINGKETIRPFDPVNPPMIASVFLIELKKARGK